MCKGRIEYTYKTVTKAQYSYDKSNAKCNIYLSPFKPLSKQKIKFLKWNNFMQNKLKIVCKDTSSK